MRHRLFILMLVSVALKFWLVAAQPVVAHANASFDDRLYLALAEQILKGHWLGPYSQFTLMKGPMYSLFIAGANIVHLPLPLAQHALYLAGCVFVVLALRPWLTNRWQGAVLFTLLWWQPMSYFELDVLRQNIYTPLSLLVFAGLIALHTRRPIYPRLLWGILLGISAGAFYLTREEGIWIVPSAVLLVVWAFASTIRFRQEFLLTLTQFIVATSIAAGIVMTVCALNYHYYGWFGTVELRAPEFRSAYGALQRPIASEELLYVPVNREVRLRLYDLSPSFKELQPCLEGPTGLEWANYSDYLTGKPGQELQIGGGSFLWALRDCVVSSGHAANASDALQFYRALGNEVNAACDDGRAGRCRPRRDTMTPRFKSGQIERLLHILPSYTADLFLFREFTAYPTESWGSADLLTLFQDLTRWKLAPSNEAPELKSATSPLDNLRLNLLQVIGQTVRWLCVAVIVSGIVAWMVAAFGVIRSRCWSDLLFISTAALGAALAVLMVNMLVHAIAFRNQGPTALHEAYPLLVLFGVTAWYAAIGERISTAAQSSAGPVTG